MDARERKRVEEKEKRKSEERIEQSQRVEGEGRKESTTSVTASRTMYFRSQQSQQQGEQQHHSQQRTRLPNILFRKFVASRKEIRSCLYGASR